MKEDVFKMSFSLSNSKVARVWEKLQRRETFIEGQLPPYRVEFETGLKRGEFESGEKNIHHGPLLSVHGEIGEISDEYRSLLYYYGSYVLSFRLVRPTLLEFRRKDGGIELKLKCYVHPYFKSIWRAGNTVFWSLFGLGLNAR